MQHIATARPAAVAGRDISIKWQDAAGIFAMVLLALGLRLYLMQFHDVITADGTSYVGTARAFKAGDIHGLATYGFYPVLIRLAGMLVSEMEMAGRLVSVVLGSLLVVPLYLLGAEIFSRRTALAACLVTAVWPPLAAWSCEVMTQATYITLAISGVYCVWMMIKRPSAVLGLGAGICLSLAYLTRPEGFLLFFAAPLGPLFMRRRELRALWQTLAVYCGSFLLLFLVNILLVHHVTGNWQLSAKTGSALNDALSYYLRIPDLSYIPEVKAYGYLDILREYPDFIWKNSFHNLKETWKTMAPFPVWFLALTGFLAGGFQPGKNSARLFLFSTFGPLFVIIIFYYVGVEYTQEYLPVLFLWAGEGGIWLERFAAGRIPALGSELREKWIAHVPLTLVLAVLFAGSVVVRQIPADSSHLPYNPESDGGRRDHKNIGLLLKEHLPPGKIMTRWARIAYYADREWVTIPKTDLEAVIRTARESGVRFIVVDGGLSRQRPELEILFSPFEIDDGTKRLLLKTPENELFRDTGLRPYLFYLDPQSFGVAIYEIVG
jgi:4-amino-4-deoxy-L-arabinose transferase-like glycosyltransferase